LCWIAYVLNDIHHKAESPEINPQPAEITWKNLGLYLAQKKSKQHFGGSLPSSIITTATANVRGHYSIYLEDLQTGTWWGLGEKEAYNAWSLLKVSTLVALLKKAEREQISLDEGVVLTPEELRHESPYISNKDGLFKSLSIKKLAERMIETSDDAAAIALCKKLTFDEFQETFRVMAMPPATPPNILPCVSPEQYARLLKSLYHANYLDKTSCDVALSLLSHTVFTNQIRAGIPNKIQLAHKVGFNADTGDYHDCGIVFLPDRPYVLCVMSTGTTKEDADRVISSLSRQVYEFMDGRNH